MLLLLVILSDAYMWTELGDGIVYAVGYIPFYGLYATTFVIEALFIDDAHSIHVRFVALNENLEATLMVPSYQGSYNSN